MGTNVILTTDETAEILRIRPQTLITWIGQGDEVPRSFILPGSKKRLFLLHDIEKYLSDCTGIPVGDINISPPLKHADTPTKQKKKTKADIIRERNRGLMLAAAGKEQ